MNFVAEIAGDRIDHLVGDGVRSIGRRNPTTAGLAMDSHAHLHLFLAQIECRLPAAGTVQLVSATPIERVRALTRSSKALEGSKVAARLGGRADDLLDDKRACDAAPPNAEGGGLDRDIVVGDRESISPSTSSPAISKFMRSPE